MSIEKWQEITDNISEKHTDECAEYLAKNGRASATVDGGEPVEIKLSPSPKKPRRGLIAGIAAAGIALCAVGGTLLFKGDSLLPSDTETTETSQTIETAETAATSDTSETAEAVIDPDLIAPEFSYDEDRWEVSWADEAWIREQLGYDTPVDVTTLREYEYALEWYKEVDEEGQQALLSHNYSSISLDCAYLGSEKADWLYCASYSLDVGGKPSSYYKKYVLVKDNNVTETVAEFTGASDSWFVYWMNNVLFTGVEDIYYIDRGHCTLNKVCDTQNWCEVLEAHAEHIIYRDSDNVLKVLHPLTGQIVTTDIPMGMHEGSVYRYDGERVISYDYTTDDEDVFVSYDLTTGEKTQLTAEEAHWDPYFFYEQSESVSNEHYLARTDQKQITVQSRDTGDTLRFSLEELIKLYADDEAYEPYVKLLNLDGNMLYFIVGDHIAALDVMTYQADVLYFEEGRTYDFDPVTSAVFLYSHEGQKRYAATLRPKEDDKVLTIWSYNNSIMNYLQYVPDFVIDGDNTGLIGNTRFVFREVPGPNADGDYMLSLIHRLKQEASGEIPSDEQVDLFVLDESFGAMDRVLFSDYTLPLSDIGITDAETDRMYPYTKQLVTDDSGDMKGAAWQANPGVFAYRRSMAREVFGTDDPEIIQQYVSDWDSFDNAAELLKQHGYHILSGFNSALPAAKLGEWLDDSGNVVIPTNVQEWLERAENWEVSGYTAGHSIWGEEWAQDFEPDGKVFGCFFPMWGVEFTLMGNAGEDGYGDWAVCAGPQGFYWGNTVICASAHTDQPELCAYIIRSLTCDYGVLRSIAEDGNTMEFVNNMAVMDDLSAEGRTSDFLGGQNSFAVFSQCAKELILPDRWTAFTVSISERASYSDLLSGELTLDEMLTQLRDSIAFTLNFWEENGY